MTNKLDKRVFNCHIARCFPINIDENEFQKQLENNKSILLNFRYLHDEKNIIKLQNKRIHGLLMRCYVRCILLLQKIASYLQVINKNKDY